LKRLVLVGVEHGDPEGFKRTTTLLSSLRPDLILIELSPFGRSFRAKRQRDLLKTLSAVVSEASAELNLALRDSLRHPNVVRIRRQICLPFEYRAARRFARAHGSRLALCDASELSRHWIASWPELLALDNIRTLLSLPWPPGEQERHYVLARKALGEDPGGRAVWAQAVESRWGSWWDRREQHVARSVWNALHVLTPQTPLYLGGWQHLVRGRSRPTLRTLLNIPFDRCRLLAGADPRKSLPSKPLSMQAR
jgi:hypothetical protein